jgi:hypothetical protein
MARRGGELPSDRVLPALVVWGLAGERRAVLAEISVEVPLLHVAISTVAKTAQPVPVYLRRARADLRVPEFQGDGDLTRV